MGAPGKFIRTFQGGKRAVQVVSATAGNAAKNLSPGVGKRWEILFGRITLVADANASNRYMVIQTTDGTNLTVKYPMATTAITAGLTKSTSFMKHTRTHGAGNLPANEVDCISIGKVILEGVDQLRFTSEGGLAGDSFSGYVVVLEIDA